ncbi:MAG: type II toxin-antitoxin system mRNA interferase toxin, RelE/StbE family [Clostridia bacterium]|nr:type II toxin-antitoxin system mRNA interferase toxin, RelE/StbE family [Clostridia bacterium]MBN2883957.1 type II toxin-antitoxin system mRNA interferase toxin, RelE/StbE family [Clostridia bacterium]
MKYEVIYHEKVFGDIKQLKFSKEQLIKLKEKIEILAGNPYPKAIGGLGEPLSGDLKGLLKFRSQKNYRIIYKLEKNKYTMKILIIGLRKDFLVYNDIKNRL